MRIPIIRTAGLIPGMAALLSLLAACDFGAPREVVDLDPRGHPDNGKRLLFAAGCVACHEVPGVSGYPGNIGPPLRGWANRKYIAGSLPNQPEELVRWILDPQGIEAGTAMPDLNLTESEAQDIAAYLYTLEDQP